VLLLRQLHNTICNDLIGRLQLLASDSNGPSFYLMKIDDLVSTLSLDVEEVREDVKRYIKHLVEQFQSQQDIPEPLTKLVESGIFNSIEGFVLVCVSQLVCFLRRSMLLEQINDTEQAG
jgi:hypothetical protein